MEPLQEPHVIVLPFPAQGHIKPMLHLAQLLANAGIRITFATSDVILDRTLHQMDLHAFLHRFPNFRFEPLSDGFPINKQEYSSITALVAKAYSVTTNVTSRVFRELLASLCKENSPPTCVIADGIMSFAIDVGREFRVPVMTFRTYSATCTWVYFHIQKLIDQRLIPFQQGEMDTLIECIPGLERSLRLRDLPGFCRNPNIGEDSISQFYLAQTSAMTKASALILNTFQELEPSPISYLGSIFPKVYAIGPVHALTKTAIEDFDSLSSSGSLQEQNRSCMTWLDCQQPKSVLYISFGSIVELTNDQILEFWDGVVNSGKPFLWVLRSDLIRNGPENNNRPSMADCKQGLIVKWAPQEEVLAHPAVGGFLSHCGWNSTLESILAGVSMVGWPAFADQQVNSRCVGVIWEVGIDLKDTWDRLTVENAVRELMEEGGRGGRKREAMLKRADELGRLARGSVEAGGSSYGHLDELIKDLRRMSSGNN